MCAAAALAACLEARPRPGPPHITVTLGRTTVQSPDTLEGTVRVEDPDGLDSVWVTVDTTTVGEDGLLKEVFASRYRFPIRAGHPLSSRVPVAVRARDLAAFEVSRDTYVVVVP